MSATQIEKADRFKALHAEPRAFLPDSALRRWQLRAALAPECWAAAMAK
jgi:hypothetical protein